MKKEYTKMPISEVIKTPGDGFFHHYVDRYWAITKNDEIIMHPCGSAQCNPHKEIVQRLVDGNIKDYPAVKVVFLESVWLSHDCNDYIY